MLSIQKKCFIFRVLNVWEQSHLLEWEWTSNSKYFSHFCRIFLFVILTTLRCFCLVPHNRFTSSFDQFSCFQRFSFRSEIKNLKPVKIVKWKKKSSENQSKEIKNHFFTRMEVNKILYFRCALPNVFVLLLAKIISTRKIRIKFHNSSHEIRKNSAFVQFNVFFSWQKSSHK